MESRHALFAIRRHGIERLRIAFASGGIVAAAVLSAFNAEAADKGSRQLDQSRSSVLQDSGLSGRGASTLEARLKRRIDHRLAELGRLLFFDVAGGLHNDDTCAGCHAPAAGFGDTQSIAIGVQDNGIVGPSRTGPYNQRRAPMVIDTALYPKLMWNGRFRAPGGDPFSNALDFTFPPPEGTSKFPPNDPHFRHLLVAQAHIPPTELVEVAGFGGTKGTIGPRFDQFDDYPLCIGSFDCTVPAPDSSGFRNEPIRRSTALRGGSAMQCPSGKSGGALVFFGKGKCACHSVAGQSNEMFSDFQMHNIGVPLIAPAFGAGLGNMIFDGPDENEDFGLEQLTGNPGDRYKFRSSPLRNVGLQPAFFHNGAFTRLEDAIRHHLDPALSATTYDPRVAGVDSDLASRVAPPGPILATLDPVLASPIVLNAGEFNDLVAFVRNGLLDPKARPEFLCELIPFAVPSGMSLLYFEGRDQER